MTHIKNAVRHSPELKWLLSVLVLVWFGLVFWAGATGRITPLQGQPPLPIAAGVLGPIAVFLVAYGLSARFRAFVLSLDAGLLTAVHAWRMLGGVFIVLHLRGQLPGSFAWPAGLGDIAVAAAAPFVAMRLARRPGLIGNPWFALFHVLGLLDFAVAVGSGTLSSGAFPGLGLEVSTRGVMDVLPLSLIPTFLVPLFSMTHLAVLFQAGRARRAESMGSAREAPPAG